MRPGMGHSLIPSFSTSSRCRPTKPISRPGNHEDVQREESRKRGAGDDGPAEQEVAQSTGPTTGTRLEMDAPMPKPQ